MPIGRATPRGGEIARGDTNSCCNVGDDTRWLRAIVLNALAPIEERRSVPQDEEDPFTLRPKISSRCSSRSRVEPEKAAIGIRKGPSRGLADHLALSSAAVQATRVPNRVLHPPGRLVL